MITSRLDLGYEYPSFTEEVLHTCLEIRKEKGYPINENEIEHYYNKLQSIATNLSGEMKITNASAREVVEKYTENLPYSNRYNLLDILDSVEKGASGFGKLLLGACLLETLDPKSFYTFLDKVTIGNGFIKIEEDPYSEKWVVYGNDWEAKKLTNRLLSLLYRYKSRSTFEGS